MGYWRHAFDKLLYSYIKPERNVIPLEDSDNEEDRFDNDSPVSSISDQYSTDDTYNPESSMSISDSTISSENPSSDGILAENDEVLEPSDSDTIINSTDDEITNDEILTSETAKNKNDLILDFTKDEQKKLDKAFDSVFYSTPRDSPFPENQHQIFSYFEVPESRDENELAIDEDFEAAANP